MSRHAISPTRQENYPEWYQQIIKEADLAEHSSVRGCMVIKPWGYAIWENMQRILDEEIKRTGHVNAYFPLLIPLSYFEKEAQHVAGFAKECAVVTHHRLAFDENNKLAPSPAAELEEPLIIRPTSEVMIGECFARWIRSYRDLPILINQWANVMRWEMRTRLFLRTSEFLWQEGHTAHSTAEEAQAEAKKMIEVYRDFAENTLAIPVIVGEKTPEERFPGAVNTYTIEAMMQDCKALQAGTSHFLGQNFAKASEIKFSNREDALEYAWTTSWGVSTRLIGGLIMAHSDDDGLVLPPKIAPQQIIILPIYRNEEEKQKVLPYCEELKLKLQSIYYHHRPLQVQLDNRELNSGERAWQAIKKGVPVRIEIGPRDLQNDAVFLGRRDYAPNQKSSLPRLVFLEKIGEILDEIQSNIYQRAVAYRDQASFTANSKAEFIDFFKNEAKSGFIACFSSNHPDIFPLLDELKITARCIPLSNSELGPCIFTGQENSNLVIYARSY